MVVVPLSREGVVAEIAGLIGARTGRVRVVIDGPVATGTGELAAAVRERLRAGGRAAVAVHAADYLRPASVRLELGREDPDELLDRWLDDAALVREVLGPGGPGGSGRVLPRLWNAEANRAYRDPYVELPADAVVLLHGPLLLGRGLPLDVIVHLRMGAAALARHVPGWQRPAYARYAAERNPEGAADLLVLADHPDRPAIRRQR